MKVAVVLLFAATVFADDILTSNIDIEELVANTDTLKNVVDCFLETEPCSELDAQIKKLIPDIVKHGCADCSKEKKHIINVFLTNVKEELPEDYEKLIEKYDPENQYFDSLEAAVAT